MLADLVRKARSIRRYDEAATVGEETLRRWVDAARVAPCGGNMQPLRYRLVLDPAERELVYPAIRWAGALPDWPGPAVGERPPAFIALCYDASRNQPGIDTGIAAQTLQLVAAADGYGACMLGAIDRDTIHAALHLDSQRAIALLMAFGLPKETVRIDPMEPDGPHAYWRDDAGMHHVPKLGLEDVLIG